MEKPIAHHLPAVRESSAWKFLEGTCQLDVQCLRILQLHERRSRAVNRDDHERKAHWSRGCVNITLCFELVHFIHAQCALVVDSRS